MLFIFFKPETVPLPSTHRKTPPMVWLELQALVIAADLLNQPDLLPSYLSEREERAGINLRKRQMKYKILPAGRTVEYVGKSLDLEWKD